MMKHSATKNHLARNTGKLLRSIAAVMLAAFFVFGYLPAFIGVAAETASDLYDAVKASDAEVKGTGPSSGTIDGSVYWWISGGKLTIRLLGAFAPGDGGGFGYNTSTEPDAPVNKKASRTAAEHWPWDGRRDEITQVAFILNDKGANVGFIPWSSGKGRDENYMFANCPNLTSVDLSGLDTTNAGGLARMFSNCPNLTEVNLGDFKSDSKVYNLQYMFYNCSALTTVTMPGTDFVMRNDSLLNSMFEGCSALTTINGLANFDLSMVKEMKFMFKSCSSLTELDLSSPSHPEFRVLDSIVTMKSLVYGCTNLTTLILDGVDNSNIGPYTANHSITDPCPAPYTWQTVGAKEFSRDLGLRHCENLTTLSAKGSKIWMTKDAKGTPGEEYFSVSSDSNVLWWWTMNDSPAADELFKLTFVADGGKGTFELTKRDYVDLIADRDGKAENSHTLDGATELPDKDSNINIKNDLNPNGPGFLAPGVYTVDRTKYMNKNSLSMPYTDYRISYIGDDIYKVFVNEHTELNGSHMHGDIVTVEHGNHIAINTVKKDSSYWGTSGDYTILLDGGEGKGHGPTIDVVFKNAAGDNAAAGEMENRMDVRVRITKITFKDLEKIRTIEQVYAALGVSEREHDFNNYINSRYDKDTGTRDELSGEYYRNILKVEEVGLQLLNYVSIDEPNTEGRVTALSGGSGTDIEFEISLGKLEEGGNFANEEHWTPIEEGHTFAYYVDDLDVPASHSYEARVPGDVCFDYLDVTNATYGLDGEGFILGDGNKLDTISFANHTGLTLTSDTRAGKNYVIATGSDPSTSWSEFAVAADASNSKYTWTSGIGCTTYALRNTPKVAANEQYIVYDFSTSIEHLIDSLVLPGCTYSVYRIEDRSEFDSRNLFDFEVSELAEVTEFGIMNITDKVLKLGILMKLDFDDAANTSNIEYQWLNITLIPATNVHYEETYLKFNDTAVQAKTFVKEWGAEGGASYPVYDATEGDGEFIGTGDKRQSDKNELYGRDVTYDDAGIGDSNGRSMHITLGSDDFVQVRDNGKAWPNFTFSFKGTGFDVIGRTGLNTGVYKVVVKNAATGKTVKSQMINTRYYGATHGANGNEDIGADGFLYQVPIAHIVGLPYGDYNVKVEFVWMPGLALLPSANGAASMIPGIENEDFELINLYEFDEAALNDKDMLSAFAAEGEVDAPDFDVYVDAIRIYNPAGSSSDMGADSIVKEAYTAAGELDPTYTEIRTLINDSTDLTGGIDSVSGAIAIDATPHTDKDGNFVMPQDGFAAAAYVAYGPNNEMYLKKGQGFAFQVDFNNITKLHISAKAAYKATEMTVYLRGENTSAEKTFAINTATEMYYDISSLIDGMQPADGKVYVVITNSDTSGSILSVCNIKTVSTGSATPNIVADNTALELAAALIAGNKGDVNADGKVDVTDAIIALRGALGISELGVFSSYCADMSADDKLTIDDVMLIIREAILN